MKYDGNIEKLYRDTFSEFEADAAPDTWDRIEQSIRPEAPSPDPSSTAGSAGKSAAGWWAGGAVVVAGLVAGLVFFGSDNEQPNVNPTPTTTVLPDEPASAEISPAADASKPTETVENRLQTTQAVLDPEPVPETSGRSHEVFTALDEIKPLASQATLKVDHMASHSSGMPEPATRESKTEHAIPPVSAAVDAVKPGTDLNPAPSAGMAAAEKRFTHRLSYPNIITPNGDGKNEIFVIESDYILSLQVQVIDMSGKIIHQWNSLHGFWDGRLENGELAPEGKYLINIFAVREDGEPVHEPPVTLVLKR